jgi:hypothetical protein
VISDAGTDTKRKLFVIDHHHLVCGVQCAEKVKDKQVYVQVMRTSKYSSVDNSEDFWSEMTANKNCYLTNEFGEECLHKEFPTSWAALYQRDDPWRSVAYATRKSDPKKDDGVWFKNKASGAGDTTS